MTVQQRQISNSLFRSSKNEFKSKKPRTMNIEQKTDTISTIIKSSFDLKFILPETKITAINNFLLNKTKLYTFQDN